MILKITQIGNSLEVVLPKKALAKLKLEKEDMLYLTESTDGYRVTPYDPEFEEHMTAARKIKYFRRLQ